MQAFRDLVHGFFGKAVLALVIALFVLYGTEALLSLTASQRPVAQVNDAELFRDQLAPMIQRQRDLIMNQNPGLPESFLKDEFLRTRVIQQWVDRQLIVQSVDEWGLRPDQTTVLSRLQSDPRFSVDGKIQQEPLEAWLRANGITVAELFQDIRRNLGIDALVSSLATSELIVPKQVSNAYRLQKQARTFRLATIDFSSLEDRIALSDDQVRDFYDSNRNDFMAQVQVQLDYVVLDKSKITQGLNQEPDEAVLKGLYATYQQSLKQLESRKAAHILIDTADRTDDEALVTAQEVYKKLKDGGDFALLAKEYSDDDPSAEDGGALPVAERGTYVESFEQALYQLAVGEFSEPVKTEFGYHIIRLDDIQEKEAVSFEEKRPELVEEFIARQQTELFQQQLDEVQVLAFESPHLEAISESLGVEIVSTDLFDRDHIPAVLTNPKLLDVVFDQAFFDEARNSDLIEVGDQAFVLHPVKFVPTAPKPFEEVVEQVKKMAVAQETRLLAEELGRKAIAQLKLSKPLDTVLSLDWERFNALDRRSAETSAAMIQKVFSMPKPIQDPVYASLIEGDAFVIVELQEIHEFESEVAGVNGAQSDLIQDGSPERELSGEEGEKTASDMIAQASTFDRTEFDLLADQLIEQARQSTPVLLIDALRDGVDIDYNFDLIDDIE